ncbi:MAG: hypothetical protein HRU69_03120 [Flammeovirgaceae bacterium]|nr:MAG: hypothetical protein HRU69_03120 [Flammeovirgaceae bacterium]
MKKFSLPKVPIDWPNHVIGFFSALFGILIAFELDSWRERSNQHELTTQALERLKTEILINQNSLHSNIRGNLEKIDVLQRLAQQLTEDLLFTGSKAAADSVNKTYKGLVFIDFDSVASKSIFIPVHISSSSLALGSYHTAAWESAKATGVLNFMAYEQVLALSSLYTNTTIMDEQLLIRQLTRKADDITSRSQLLFFLSELEEAYLVIGREMDSYDQFVNMVTLSD